ncbi:chromosome segregation protein Smc [Candidatus Termititenax spirochaetophilus]|uniref:Chromosome partition protein Smc n=1 Tax=Candidatus Termititenax spirochaetophilus TaxID=2218522 RepID=A0A388T869_9BACT|nr:chromosome segregation protein Smc [Candidatus Termititenax spirochaetophilus]
MHLKKLELCGFKTFPDKTILEFTDAHGITGIVGPNGCGKSNIIDAFRWVMGEQSIKTLRGTAAEEVIFSGTEDRKPVSMAEVFLTIDNADHSLPVDYTEVEVGRRYYRTGDSEYLINKEVVRLRDVQELLMDTGIGKGSYAIIGQGQVLTLLHSKPEDRRELFEEAAGINKYKTRKIATQRKLEHAEQNLFRLSDIRTEIHQQLGPLEEQAREALEYQVLKKDLSGLEIGLVKVKLGKLEIFKQEIDQKIAEYKKVVAEADNSAQNIASKKQEFRDKMVELDKRLADYDNQLQELRRRKADSANKFDVAKERIGNHQQRLQAIEQEISQLTANREALLARQNESTAELTAVVQSVTELEERLAKKNDEARDIIERWQQVNQEITDLRKDLTEFTEQLENKNSKLMGLNTGETVVANDLQRIEVTLTDFSKEKEDIARRETELTERKNFVDTSVNDLRTRRDELFKQKSDKDEERKNKLNLRMEIKEKFDQQSSRLNLLEEMQQTHEGFQKGVRSIFQAKKDNVDGFSGVTGVVADIINVPKQYESAIEAALENNLQAVVAADQSTVEQVIKHLKDHALGRATFAAGGLLKPAAKIVPLSGVCALDVVSCEEQYKDFIAALLGSVCIVDDLEQALHTSLDGLSAVVTLSGEVVTARGLITGGSVGKEKESVSLLGRQREIIELKKDIEQYTADLSRLDGEIKNIEQLFVEIEEELKDHANKLKHLEIEQGTIANDLARLSIDRSKLERNIAANRQEISQQQGEMSRIAVEKQNLQNALDELIEQKEAKEKFILEKETALQQADTEKTKVNELLTEIKISSTNALGVKRQIELKLESFRDNIRQTEAQHAEKTTEKENLLKSIAEAESILQSSQNVLPEIDGSIEQMQVKVGSANQERSRYFNDLEVYDRMEKERNDADREVRSKLSNEEVKMAKVEAEYEEISHRMANEYNLTIADVLQSEAVVEDYDKTQDEVEKLKRRIKRMEPVNLLAIEEFEAQKERLVFIETQCEDLEKSKTDLLNIIKELDQTAIEAFKETFNIVNEHFKRIFVDLFKGGYAELQILDESNVLESGIEIYAKVPGGPKKAQSMTLLSGGQKSLTAIALLFALLSARPGPFCIMDEIDDALDDLNIGRVTEILKEFASRTQIIIITHRQAMMSVVDMIFGLTMPQKGVSKIVSLKLPEAEKALLEA